MVVCFYWSSNMRFVNREQKADWFRNLHDIPIKKRKQAWHFCVQDLHLFDSNFREIQRGQRSEETFSFTMIPYKIDYAFMLYDTMPLTFSRPCLWAFGILFSFFLLLSFLLFRAWNSTFFMFHNKWVGKVSFRWQKEKEFHI